MAKGSCAHLNIMGSMAMRLPSLAIGTSTGYREHVLEARPGILLTNIRLMLQRALPSSGGERTMGGGTRVEKTEGSMTPLMMMPRVPALIR